MQPSTLAGSGVGAGGAIALVKPLTTLAMYHLNLNSYPSDVADAYSFVLGAAFSIVLTVAGGWVAKLIAKTGTPSAG